MEAIASRRNAIVSMFRDLGRRRDPIERRLLLDGLLLLNEAHASGWKISVAAFSARQLDRERHDVTRLITELEGTGTRILRVSENVLAAISPARTPSGVVAIAERPDAVSATRALAREAALLLIVSDLQEPGNLGAVVRSAEAGGATGLIVCGHSANPFGWKALRGSMGSAFRLPVVVERDAGAAIGLARGRGLRVLAAAPRVGRSLYDVELTGPTAFLLGGEAHGLTPELAALADETVSVPMTPSVESLNAAVSAALLVYEASRQRQAHSQRLISP